MGRKITGTIIVAIFLFSTIVIANPVQAHFTLGDLTPTYRFHANDFDPHVAGVIGYVWPGGGLDSYTGFLNSASSVNSPGYMTPYPCRLSGEPVSQAGGTILSPGPQCNPSGAPTSSWYQLQGSAYAPFGAVLTGSTGDLIFALNATAFQADGVTPFSGRWRGLGLLLPPGFSVPDSPQIVTTITNDYTGIAVIRVGPYDRYAPGWTLIQIYADAGCDAPAPITPVSLAGTASCSRFFPAGGNPGYYDHQAIDFTSAGEWYYVRINGVLAPSIAGRYFFKVLLYSSTRSICGEEGIATGSGLLPAPTVPTGGVSSPEACSQFIPTENWPVLLVKGEIDPAIITGTVRYAGYNSTLYGMPVGEAGMVYAKMTMRLDPYTGQPRPDLPTVDARGYFNGTVSCAVTASPTDPECVNANGNLRGANGHYEVEGVAPGIYDIYAQAAGFPQQVCASSVTILKGQSLHFDCYVQPGPVIHGNVFTKHQFGDEPWMGELPPCTSLNGATPVSTGIAALSSPSQIPGTSGFCSFNTYNEYIKIELYDGPTLSHVPDPSANLVSWSPLPCVAGGQDLYTGKIDAGSCGDPRLGSQIAFPWHEYTPGNGYLNFGGTLTGGKISSGFYQVSESGSLISPSPGNANSVLLQDPQGVGPPQNWFVQGGTTIPFHFEMGVKAEYGAPRDLDGQVPQVYATWVNGLTPGRYYVRAWVFRYVQSALDGSTFQEYYFDVTPQEWAGDVTLPIDLRLSSWVNKTVHFHDQLNGLTEDPIDTGAGLMSGVLVGSDGRVWSYNQTLLGYEGCYSIGKLSGWGSNAFFRGPPGSNCPLICPGSSFCPSTASSSTTLNRNDLDKAKLNQYAIESGRANIQFYGWNDTWGGENYGIPSGTYTPHVYALGYLENPPEQVSVTLSGTSTSVSDHMYRGVGFNLTIYSIDWERPTVSRNWVWGNPVGYTTCGFFMDPANRAILLATQAGFVSPPPVGTVSPACSGLGNVNQNHPTPVVPPDPRCPGTSLLGLGCMVGQEIDVGIYANGSLIDFVGDEPSFLADTVLTSCLFQSQTNSSITMCGGGWDPATKYLSPPFPGVCNSPSGGCGYEGNSNGTYFGQELDEPGSVGGYVGGLLYFSVNKLLFGPAHFTVSTLPDGSTYNQAVQGYLNLYPSAIPGGQYTFRGFTYGYVQDQTYTIYALPTEVADIRLNLVIGVNVTLDVLFKKEHVITPTPYNMSARVRLFDDSGSLVAEWMSSEGVYTPRTGRATAADGTDPFPFGPLHPAVPVLNGVPTGENTYNFLPGGVSLLHVLMAGLPQVPPGGTDSGVSSPDVPQSVYFNDPIFATTTCGFEVDCYTTPGIAKLTVGVPGYFPNTGILGSPDYQGGWTAEVDFVNWYNNNTSAQEPGNSFRGPFSLPTNPSQTPSEGTITNPIAFGQYFTPVQGLLLGESYHIIPGTTATSGISLTEDGALNPQLVGHSLAANHLGPYSQEGVWQISGSHLSGEASGIFEVDLNGFVSGTALAFTWVNDFRPLSWATVSVTGANGASWNYYTFDGQYGMYLIPGSYSLTIASPGIASQTLSIAVTGGESGTAGNLYMQQSNIPVPEFSNIVIVAFAALAASLYVLQRRRRK